MVHGCSFEDIKCWNNENCILFNDALGFCDVSMTSISVTDCDSALYSSSHSSISAITMTDIFVATSKYWKEDESALLTFADTDSVEFIDSLLFSHSDFMIQFVS